MNTISRYMRYNTELLISPLREQYIVIIFHLHYQTQDVNSSVFRVCSNEYIMYPLNGKFHRAVSFKPLCFDHKIWNFLNVLKDLFVSLLLVARQQEVSFSRQFLQGSRQHHLTLYGSYLL